MIFSFGEILVGAKFELFVSEQLESASIENMLNLRTVEFDLTDVTFIDCYCTQLLVCYLSVLEKHGILTKIKLPKSKRVRDILRCWNLDSAIKKAIGRNLHSLCNEDQRIQYFYPNDRQITFDLSLFPRIYPDDNGNSANNQSGEPVVIENFFGFRTLDVPDDDSKADKANSEKKLWQKFNVKTILEQELKLDVRFFSARIVFEAVFNALRHPSADLIQTAAQPLLWRQAKLPFHVETKRDAAKSLVLHYWDNGTSFIDVIRSALETGTGFRTAPADSYATRYKIAWKDHGVEAPSFAKTITCGDEVDAKSHTAEIIAYALQPFVSMSPNKPGHASTEETGEDDPRLTSVGMGLYLLLDTAIRRFGGKLRIRTSNIHIDIYQGQKKVSLAKKQSMKKPNEAVPLYKVDVRVMDSRLPAFPGNIFVVSVPEQKATS